MKTRIAVFRIPKNLYVLVPLIVSIATAANWFISLTRSLKTSNFVYPPFLDDEHYIARARQIWEGNEAVNIVSGNGNVKDGTTSQTEIIFFKIGSLLADHGISFTYYFITIATLTTILASYSFYLLLKTLLPARASLFFTFALFIIATVWIDGVKIVSNPFQSGFERWPNPNLHFIMINLVIMLLLKEDKKLSDYAALSCISSISFYTYFYSWQVIFTTFLTYLALKLFTKQYTELKRMGSTVLIALILGAPYLLEVINSTRYNEIDLDKLYFEQIGLLQTHSPSVTKYLVFGIFLIYVSIKVRSPKRLIQFNYLIVLTSWIILNQNVLTGSLVQPGHYHWYFIKPYITLAALSLITSKIEIAKFYKYAGMLLSLILISSVWIISVNGERMISSSSYRITDEELKSLRKNIFSFDTRLNTFLAINTNNSPALLPHMIYYKNATKSIERYCLAHSIWFSENFETSEILKSASEIQSCRSLESAFGIGYLKQQVEIVEPISYVSDWLELNSVKTLALENQPTQVQAAILSGRWGEEREVGFLRILERLE